MKTLITENGIKITAQKKFTVNSFPEPLPITAFEEMEKRHAHGWRNCMAKVYRAGDDFFYRWWKIYPEMPEGYSEDKNTGSPLSHTVFIINGSPLSGGERALLYVKQLHSCSHNYNYKILFDHTAVSVCSKCKKRVKA